jgi:hypothetical protein
MIDLTDILYRTKKTVLQAKREALVGSDEQVSYGNLDQCSHCNIWYKNRELHKDLDGSLICKFCSDNYGD